jgi:hypothetical protein
VKVKIYKTIILPILYGCETWSLILREDHRLRVSENRLLRRLCAPKRDGVTGEWRKLNNGELHNLYSSTDIIRQKKSRGKKWVEHVTHMGEGRNVYGVSVGKPEEKRPVERRRSRRENRLKLKLRDIAWGCGLDYPLSG